MCGDCEKEKDRGSRFRFSFVFLSSLTWKLFFLLMSSILIFFHSFSRAQSKGQQRWCGRKPTPKGIYCTSLYTHTHIDLYIEEAPVQVNTGELLDVRKLHFHNHSIVLLGAPLPALHLLVSAHRHHRRRPLSSESVACYVGIQTFIDSFIKKIGRPFCFLLLVLSWTKPTITRDFAFVHQ